MLSTVVTQNLDTAQVFFLIALICAAVATIFALVSRATEVALVAGAVTFASAGLLYFS